MQISPLGKARKYRQNQDPSMNSLCIFLPQEICRFLGAGIPHMPNWNATTFISVSSNIQAGKTHPPSLSFSWTINSALDLVGSITAGRRGCLKGMGKGGGTGPPLPHYVESILPLSLWIVQRLQSGRMGGDTECHWALSHHQPFW